MQAKRLISNQILLRAGVRCQARFRRRHTYASILAAGGVREDVVAVLMGHKRPGTTSIYTHLFGDAFEGVEEALDRVLGVNGASMERGVTTDHNGNGADSAEAENRVGAGTSGP